MNLTTEAHVLNSLIRPVYATTEICKIRFEENKTVINSTDGRGMSLVDVELTKDTFETYSAEGDVIAVDLDKISALLNMADGSENSEISVREDNYLNLRIGRKNFTLGLVSLNSVPTQPDVPDVDYPAVISLPQSVLQDAIKTANLFSDEITFQLESGVNELCIHSKGDIDESTDIVGSGELIDITSASVESSFSIEILSMMTSAIPDDTAVTIRLAHDRPIVMEYSIVEGSGSVSSMLAPWKN